MEMGAWAVRGRGFEVRVEMTSWPLGTLWPGGASAQVLEKV